MLKFTNRILFRLRGSIQNVGTACGNRIPLAWTVVSGYAIETETALGSGAFILDGSMRSAEYEPIDLFVEAGDWVSDGILRSKRPRS